LQRFVWNSIGFFRSVPSRFVTLRRSLRRHSPAFLMVSIDDGQCSIDKPAMSKFSEKLLQNRPEIIGKRVWFCLNKHQRLECIVNSDASISPCCATDKKFIKANDLIEAIADGSIQGPNFKLPRLRSLKGISFTGHLYFRSDSTCNVYYYVANPNIALPPEESTMQQTDKGSQSICNGFATFDSLFSKISCASIKVDGQVVRSRHCRRVKLMKSAMCKDCTRAKFLFKRVVERKKQQKLLPSVNGRGGISVSDRGGSHRRFSSLAFTSKSKKLINGNLVTRTSQVAAQGKKKRSAQES